MSIMELGAFPTWVSNNISINNSVPEDLRKGIRNSANLSAESEAALRYGITASSSSGKPRTIYTRWGPLTTPSGGPN